MGTKRIITIVVLMLSNLLASGQYRYYLVSDSEVFQIPVNAGDTNFRVMTLAEYKRMREVKKLPPDPYVYSFLSQYDVDERHAHIDPVFPIHVFADSVGDADGVLTGDLASTSDNHDAFRSRNGYLSWGNGTLTTSGGIARNIEHDAGTGTHGFSSVTPESYCYSVLADSLSKLNMQLTDAQARISKDSADRYYQQSEYNIRELSYWVAVLFAFALGTTLTAFMHWIRKNGDYKPDPLAKRVEQQCRLLGREPVIEAAIRVCTYFSLRRHIPLTNTDINHIIDWIVDVQLKGHSITPDTIIYCMDEASLIHVPENLKHLID